MKLTILAAFAIASVALAGDPVAEWKYTQPLEVTQSGLQKLSLPVETLDAARPGLEDLRIIDRDGREVPYVIERPVRSTQAVFSPKNMTVNLRPQEATVITVETGPLRPLDAVILETPASGFIKAVTVEASNDQHTWQPLVAGRPIFRQANGISQLRVEFPAASWPFLRVTLDDRRAEAIPVTAVKLHAVSDTAAPAESLPVTIADRTENDGQTRLTLNLGAANVTLASLRLETAEPLFTRSVSLVIRQVEESAVTERTLARDTVYRVDLEGFDRAERVELALDLPVPGRELLVLIDNGDSPPLPVSAVRVLRRPVFAVFRAPQAGTYQVLTGHPRCAAPNYDLGALRSSLALAPGVPVLSHKLGARIFNPAYRPAEPLPEVQDLGTALTVADWKFRKPVQISRTGVQQLELDLPALAHADAAFRDLRLMRDGKQRPYILERTSIQRRIVPVVTAANDPKRPALSRWQIKLPLSSLPVLRLTCTTRTTLFKREVRLYEQPTDERGEKYDRSLGNATWVRTPPATTRTLDLSLTTTPVTDTLILETDNGDNQAIELDGFQCSYPVTRIWFKAPAEPVTYLYYGNRSAGFPEYDIALVAPQLLAADKSPATLGGEESLKKPAWGESLERSRTGNAVFWVVLGVVVVVLIVVIARLLPKVPSSQG